MKHTIQSALSLFVAVALFGAVGARANNTTHSLLGIGVSNHQGFVTWSSVYGDGVRFSFAKATEGTGFTDADFAGNMSRGKSAGLQMGPYHFAHPELNCVSPEANHFWAVAGGTIKHDGQTIMPMLDLEVFNGVSCQSSYTDWANTWANQVDAKTALTINPVIYISACNACHLNANITLGAFIAAYNGENLYTGNPWQTCCNCNVWGGGCNANSWTYWQVSSTGSITGVNGDVDLNAYNGTLAELISWQGV